MLSLKRVFSKHFIKLFIIHQNQDLKTSFNYDHNWICYNKLKCFKCTFPILRICILFLKTDLNASRLKSKPSHFQLIQIL